jgi:hypothetical protein
MYALKDTYPAWVLAAGDEQRLDRQPAVADQPVGQRAR